MRLLELFTGDIQDIQITFDERIGKSGKFRVSVLYEDADLNLVLTPTKFIGFMDNIMGSFDYMELISLLEDDVVNFYHFYKVIESAINHLVSPTEVKTSIKNAKLVKILEDLISRLYASRFGRSCPVFWTLTKEGNEVSFVIEPEMVIKED